MDAIIIVLITAFVLFILSLFLFHGKGSWLIAGYNTASKEEKEKYDVKKLCRATGMICIVVCVLLCVLAFLGYQVEIGNMEEDAMFPFGLIFLGIVLATVFSAIYYTNRKCKK